MIKFEGGITKKVTRSNFYFEVENSADYKRMLEDAKVWRSMGAIYLKYNN